MNSHNIGSMRGAGERQLCALLLTGLDEAVSVERAALRQAGVLRVRTTSSGARALEILSGQMQRAASGVASAQAVSIYDIPIDFVLCTERLADMDMPVFLRELGALCYRNGWNMPPVLAVTSDDSVQATLLALGASAVLVRPYPVSAMAESLRRLQHGEAVVAQPEFSPASGLGESKNYDGMFFARRQQGRGAAAVELEAKSSQASGMLADRSDKNARQGGSVSRQLSVVSDNSQASPAESRNAVRKNAGAAAVAQKQLADGEALNPLLYTRKGLVRLRAGELEEAEDLLLKGAAYDRLDLEACLGLVKLYIECGNKQNELRWLNRAAIICLETGQKERAAVFLARLPQDYSADPHLAEARNLLCDEDYDAAAEAFLDVCHRQQKLPLHELVARASQFTDWPEFAIRELCSSYRRMGHEVTASNLYHRLLADEESEFTPNGFLAKFPRLYEAVAVARFTMHAWRRTAHI